jgi:hypothetical protein
VLLLLLLLLLLLGTGLSAGDEMERWQRLARGAMVLCLILLACAAICAVADASAMTSAPHHKNRQRTGMSGKGVWFSIISFLTSIGWIATSERETVRSSGLWVQVGRCAKTAKSPKEADKDGVVRKQRVLCVCALAWAAPLCRHGSHLALRLCCAPVGAHYRPRVEQGDHRRLAAGRQNTDRSTCVPVRHAVPKRVLFNHTPRQSRGVRSAWPVPRLSFCMGVLRRVVEQYLWHEKTKGRKHKMQIHTYHKVSSTGAPVFRSVLRRRSCVLLSPCRYRPGRGGTSSQVNLWTMGRT